VQTDHELGTAQRALSERGDAQVQAAIAAPGHQVLLLRSALGAQVAKIVVSAGRGYFVSSALRPLPRDETYQLWAMFGEQPVSIGLLGARPGHAVFTLASGSPTQLAVTVEPSGGATRPSRLPVASGSFGA
jgi:anti-sigma-K factor RskA